MTPSDPSADPGADPSAERRAQLEQIIATRKEPAVLARAHELLAALPRLPPPPPPSNPARDAEKAGHVQRGLAAGVADDLSPTFLGKLGAAFDPEAMSKDIGRTRRDVFSGASFGLSDNINPAQRAADRAQDASDQRFLKNSQGDADSGPLGSIYGALGSPSASGVGKLSGALLSSAVGPLAGLGKVAGAGVGLVGRALPEVASPVLRGLGSIAGTAAEGAMVGGADAGIRAGGEGATAGDIGSRALAGAGRGAALAGLLGAGAQGAGAVADRVRKSTGGVARRLIEGMGGTVGPLNPGKGAIFNKPAPPLGSLERELGVKNGATGWDPALGPPPAPFKPPPAPPAPTALEGTPGFLRQQQALAEHEAMVAQAQQAAARDASLAEAQAVSKQGAMDARKALEFKGLHAADLGMAAGPVALGAYLGHGVAGGALGAVLGAAPMVARNAAPIAGRLLYKPAMAAARASEAVQGQAPAFIPEIEQLVAALKAKLLGQQTNTQDQGR